MKETNKVLIPKPRNLLLIRPNAPGLLDWDNWPSEISSINMGTPIKIRASMYGTRKEPPPNLYINAGNLHTFVNPIAEAAAAKIKAGLEDQFSLIVLEKRMKQ